MEVSSLIIDYQGRNFCVNGKNHNWNEKDITEDADVFSDVQKNSWYYAAVLTCKLKKIINGYPDGTFKPGNYASRAEAFALLANYVRILLTRIWMKSLKNSRYNS